MSTATLTQPTTTGAEGPPSSGMVVPPLPTRAQRTTRALRTGVRRSAAVVLFLLLWEFGTQYLLEPSRKVFLPPLHVVLEALWDLGRTGQLQEHLQASLTRSVIGFGLAVVAGVVLLAVLTSGTTLRRYLRV